MINYQSAHELGNKMDYQNLIKQAWIPRHYSMLAASPIHRCFNGVKLFSRIVSRAIDRLLIEFELFVRYRNDIKNRIINMAISKALVIWCIVASLEVMAWRPDFSNTNKQEESNDDDPSITATLNSTSALDPSCNIIDLSLQSLMKDHFHSKVRRELHKVPELMYNEAKTRDILIKTLEGMNITNYSTGWGKNIHTDSFPGEGGYGIVADIGTGHPPCVLLRADMDALPVHEQTSGGRMDDFRSQNPGRMHACGHDGHMTMLLGAAAVLKRMEEAGDLNGTIRIIFQPAEEGGAGGKRMREEGVLDMYPPVQHAFAMHLWPTLPSGVIGGKAGALLAGADSFEMTINGVGGHAAMVSTNTEILAPNI